MELAKPKEESSPDYARSCKDEVLTPSMQDDNYICTLMYAKSPEFDSDITTTAHIIPGWCEQNGKSRPKWRFACYAIWQDMWNWCLYQSEGYLMLLPLHHSSHSISERAEEEKGF